jgi:ferredoxin
MEINKAAAIYFSPTGTTERVVNAIAVGTGLPVGRIDLTHPSARRAFSHRFDTDEVAVIGLPVYAGRLPLKLDDFFAGLDGNGAMAAAVVMYGNREYDDALLELKMRLEERGFTVPAAAAFVGEHTFSNKIAAGRPDANDLSIAADFGKKMARIIDRVIKSTLTVKGSYPFKMKGYDPAAGGTHPTQFNITTTDACSGCRLCAEDCPWGAIDAEDPRSIDMASCMRCLRCLKNCPNGAKQIKDERFLAFLPQFEGRLGARKEPELFLVG